MGEPAGCAAELILRAWQATRDGGGSFYAIADPDWLAAATGRLGLKTPVEVISDPAAAKGAFAAALPVLPCPLATVAVPGDPDPANAAAVVRSIEVAVAQCLDGQAAAVVTNPIQKETLAAADFPHPGHTEYLGALAESAGHTAHPVMMLAIEGLRVVPATVHRALRDVPGALSIEGLVASGETVARDLGTWFGVRAPRLVFTGLNPHAGEGGLFGDEEIRIIEPAVTRLREAGIDARGPLAADSLFHADARATYDAAICMYHDQALIPLKTLDFHGGVNVTLGLPFIRTSPDHGTALDLAARGGANPASFLAALRMARAMAGVREAASA